MPTFTTDQITAMIAAGIGVAATSGLPRMVFTGILILTALRAFRVVG